MSLSLSSPASMPVPVGVLPAVSPLTIADRLITLAEEADRAGYASTASNLVHMVLRVLDEQGAELPN